MSKVSHPIFRTCFLALLLSPFSGVALSFVVNPFSVLILILSMQRYFDTKKLRMSKLGCLHSRALCNSEVFQQLPFLPKPRLYHEHGLKIG